MAANKGFTELLDLELKDLIVPDYAILTFAVCAGEENSCGWGGWLNEAVFQITGEKHDSGTGDKPLPAVTAQVCPQCGKMLYRTGASIKLCTRSE